MGKSTIARDWEVAGGVAVGGGAAVAINCWVFQFRSRVANVRSYVALTAAGIGVGGKFAAAGDANFRIENNDFKRIHMENAMSLDNLHGCFGIVHAAGLAVGYGFSVVFITAYGYRIRYFLNESIYGVECGLEASISAVMGGVWAVSNDPPMPYKVPSLPPPVIDYSARRKYITRQGADWVEIDGFKRRVHRTRALPGQSIMTPY